MAPGRKKGAGKATTTAAATRRLQWKIGDLVLAKVKGFPAWPASVSEPEKWGYRRDAKKVMVYFFGTQQIAFCNPADVEAFTEEKKQSLLTKHQGKGADFVRAVQEIIESYEKSKKEEQIGDSKSADELTPAIGGNFASALQDSAEVSATSSDLQSKTSDSLEEPGNNPTLPFQDVSAAAQIIVALRDNYSTCEQPSNSSVVKKAPILTTYTSRKRSGGGLRSQKVVSLKKAPAANRSSKVESYGFQSFMMQCNDGAQSAGDLSTTANWDGCLTRNKRTRKSPVSSLRDGVVSSALMSNGSIEDNDSDIVAVDSVDLTLNEGRAIDSDYNLACSDSVVECMKGDVDISEGIDFQIKTVVIKKKRKLSRKRVIKEAPESPARVGAVADTEVRGNNTCQNSQNSFKILDEMPSKEIGDEHLPLVKRARVRMGQPSSTEKVIIQAEEKPLKETIANLATQISPSSICNDDCRVDGESLEEGGAWNNTSSLKVSSHSRPQLCKVMKHQFRVSPDGEAALPPFKRFHRAMEAMSANAADQATPDLSSNKNMFANNYCVPSAGVCSIPSDPKEVKAREFNVTDSLCNNGGFCSSLNPIISKEATKSIAEEEICKQPEEDNVQELDVMDSLSNNMEFCFSLNPTISKEAKESFAEEKIYGQSFKCSINQKNEFLKDTVIVPRGNDNTGSTSSVSPVKTVIETQSIECILPQNLLASPEGERNTKNADLITIKTENSDKELVSLEHTDRRLNTGIKMSSCQDGEDLLQHNADNRVCKDTDSLKPAIDENSQMNSMCMVLEEIKSEQTQKVTKSARIDEEHSSEKRSPPQADVDFSPARRSSSSTSVYPISTEESANIILDYDCCDHNRLHEKRPVSITALDEHVKIETAEARPKSMGKWRSYSEAHAALSSFELLLTTLTRTKESIARATRMAIECAKFGVSAKVVEVLLHILEGEPNLQRRVDVFFLVDSITQSSRRLKGDGGIYPSVIQAVLPRILLATAPPGTIGHENRRQCLKVLKLWIERRILPEFIIRQQMRELDSLNRISAGAAFSRRSSRTERSLDDPVRDMDDMLVDEYGSNSTFQLAGFSMPHMLQDEKDGIDGENFEAVTPEHNSETPEKGNTTPATERHRHILEDVDGELEMEDVTSAIELSASTKAVGVDTGHLSHSQFEQQISLPVACTSRHDSRPSSLPLSPSAPLRPPLLPRTSALSDSFTTGVDSKNDQRMHEHLRHSSGQASVAPKIKPVMSSNAVRYQSSDCREVRLRNQIFEATNSFNSFPARSTNNNMQRRDGSGYHHKPYPLRPPNAAPSDQFSYIQADQYVKSWRETQSPYHRSHFVPSFDRGNHYDNYERMKPAPYESRESWRFSAPTFSGLRYSEKTKASYFHGSYAGPYIERGRYQNQRWGFPPRAMIHRNSFHNRHSSEASGIWPPR